MWSSGLEDYARQIVYVRSEAKAEAKQLLGALEGLVTQAEAIFAGPIDDEEERAFLELLEPTGDLLRRVGEWLDLADEGEETCLGFLESHPELDDRAPG